MDLEGSERDSVLTTTQVSIGGFGTDVKAYDLVSFLESEIGYVDRCRLKTSCTPPESYPEFNISDPKQKEKTDDYRKVAPHAFVHFTLAESATEALNAAGRCELILNGCPLKVICGPHNPNFLNKRRRTAAPFKMSDVIVEIGTLVSLSNFTVAWRGPAKGVNFLVDPFDSMCKLCFNRDVAFSFKGMAKKVVIKCDFKVGFLVRDILEIKRYDDTSYHVVLLHLASPPLVWYRTADDDIEESVTIDLLDDDDPWIRTTDFTPSGAIGRCSFYRISIPPRYGAKLNKALEYLRWQRVQRVQLTQPLRILNELDFGVPMSDTFFYIDFQKDISFYIMFLVKVVVHRGIFNQYSLSNHLFFELLRNQPKDVSVAALKHLCTYKRLVFDACKRLKAVQEWLLSNLKLYQISKQCDDVMEVRRLVVTPTKP